jgi:hypothetical protein
LPDPDVALLVEVAADVLGAPEPATGTVVEDGDDVPQATMPRAQADVSSAVAAARWPRRDLVMRRF